MHQQHMACVKKLKRLFDRLKIDSGYMLVLYDEKYTDVDLENDE